MPHRPILKKGASGTAVTELTRKLAALGYLNNAVSFFDGAVHRALCLFQQQQVDERGQPLKVDGVAGRVTWWRLDNPRRPAPPPPAPPPDIPTGGSSRGRAALRAAHAEMRAGACEAGANNSGPYVRKYLNGILAPPANWCAAFTSWCYDQHPRGIPFRYSLGARDIFNQFRQRSWAYDHRTQSPQPGDIVVWKRHDPANPHAGHIGLVWQSSPGGILYTLEGNKGPFPAPVKRFDYVASRMDSLLGFGRVPEGV